MKNIFIRDDKKILKGLDSPKDSGNITIFAEKGKIEKRDKSY